MNRRGSWTAVLVVVLSSAGVAAGDEPAEPPAVEEPEADTALLAEPTGPKRTDEQSVRFGYENDTFTRSDYYFTQGISLVWTDPDLASWPLALPVPQVADDALRRESWFLRFDEFTPIEFEPAPIQFGDRPFAAYILVGHRTESLAADGTNTLRAQWCLGYMGPLAGGEQVQNQIHRFTNGDHARGWRNQIEDDLIVQLEIGDTHRLLRVSDVLDAHIEFELRGGTLYSDASLGGRLRFGLLGPPATTTPEFGELYLWGAMQGRVVGFNATLEGGVFSSGDSPYTLSANDLRRFVVTAQAGVTLELGGVGFTLSWNWTSPEFSKARSHRWGLFAMTIYY